MLFWHVPAPNEALLISGSKRHADETQFRIVTGHGSFVMPIKQRARVLSLALREAEIAEECITKQGIRLNVRAVAAFKVGDDSVSIANAARRFLSEQDKMEAEVRRPADAEAYKTRTLAEASRDQARFTTEAEAFRRRQIAEADRDQAKLAAEAEAFRQTTLAESEARATRVRADAQAHAERTQAEGQADANQALAASLREGNQEVIAANALIENLPALVEAAARGLAGANLTVLNGTQGVNEVVAGLVGQGLSILDLLKKSTAAASVPSANGTAQGTLDKIA
jgi:flotillin